MSMSVLKLFEKHSPKVDQVACVKLIFCTLKLTLQKLIHFVSFKLHALDITQDGSYKFKLLKSVKIWASYAWPKIHSKFWIFFVWARRDKIFANSSKQLQVQVIAHCVYSNRNLYAFLMHIFSTPPDEADLVEATYLLLLDDKEVLKSLGFERRISRRDTRTSDDLVVLLWEKPQ